MRYICIVVLFVGLSSLNISYASQPADNDIKSALYDIEKYEKQFASGSANPVTVKRTLKLLTISRQRLDSSTNRSHASWVDADQRHTALVATLNGMLNKKTQASTQSTAVVAQQNPDRAPTSVSSSGASQAMISQYRVRIKKINRDIQSSIDTIDKAGVKPFQDGNYVKQKQAISARYQASLDKYENYRNDPDVVTATQSLAQFNNMLAFGQQQAAKDLAELGDVQANLRAIETQLRQYEVPKPLAIPFNDAQAKAWVKQAANAKQVAEKAQPPIQLIAQKAYLPNNRGTVQSGAPYDSQDVNRLFHFTNAKIEGVNAALESNMQMLSQQVLNQDDTLNYFRNLDPNNKKHQMNAFLQEGSDKEIFARLDKELALAESAAAYQRAFGKQPTAKTVERINEIKGLKDKYTKNRNIALSKSTLPEAKSKDGKRITLARQILAKPRYEFGQHGPIVLTTSDIVDRERKDSKREYDDLDVSLSGTITLKGTETTWTYKWREFKFATPIKEPNSDDWYVWWITAKKFSSGSSITPIGEWVSGGATKGSLILKENF